MQARITLYHWYAVLLLLVHALKIVTVVYSGEIIAIIIMDELAYDCKHI